MLIRDAEDTEFDEVGNLCVRAFTSLEGLVISDDYRRALFDVAGRAKTSRVLVAEDRGTVLGTVTFVPGSQSEGAEFDDPDAAGIRMLAVDVPFRDRGVGKALTQACINIARTAGRRRVVLRTTNVMATAQALYLTMGFVRDPERDWEPLPGVSLLGFVIDLGAR
jgi:ribosomal protein S18 acetylase RimI-like enzyme